MKEFYDDIIMDILNGLQSKNEAEMQRTLLTFKEYFYGKNEFYKVIIDIIGKNNND